MKCVIQRVRRASVSVGDELVSEIGGGIVVLAAVEKGDGEQTMRDAAKKIRELRIFGDEAGKMNRDLAEAGGAILAVSQFTLAGSIARGRRPSFDNAEEPNRARELFDVFLRELAATGIAVKSGRFREMMIVTLENDGPGRFAWPRWVTCGAGCQPAVPGAASPARASGPRHGGPAAHPTVILPRLCNTDPPTSSRSGSSDGPRRESR